jgi:hypothetical protein
MNGELAVSFKGFLLPFDIFTRMRRARYTGQRAAVVLIQQAGVANPCNPSLMGRNRRGTSALARFLITKATEFALGCFLYGFDWFAKA